MDSSKNYLQILKESLTLIAKITGNIFIPLIDVAMPGGIFVDSFKQNLSIHKSIVVHSFHVDIVNIFSKGK